MRSLLVALAVILALSGCARNTTKAYSTWVGAQLDDLINAWGLPYRDAKLPNGDRVVEYRVDGGVGVDYGRLTTFICNVDWQAGSDGVIKKFRWQGHAGFCVRVTVTETHVGHA